MVKIKGPIEMHYTRKYQTTKYENATLGITASFDEDTSPDDAFMALRSKIEELIEQDLVLRGVI